MVHDFSPFIIQFTETLGLRWYGFAYVMGFVAGYMMIRWMAGRQRSGLSPEKVGDLITYVAFGTLIGGRLGYVIFYSPDLFLKFKSELPFWGVLAVNEGGMASHGGMIGVVVACIFFARRNDVALLYILDLCSFVAPIGIFFGRMANFINGELLGRPADASLPWAMRFPQEILNWPSQEFLKLKSLTDVVPQIGLTPEKWTQWLEQFRLDAAAREEIYSALQRIVTQIQMGQTELKLKLAPLLTPRHPSQLYAALGEGILLFLVLFFYWRKPRKPGLVGALFLITYAIVRIIDENFRLPDAHIGYQLFGLTRGQWLSIALFFAGVFLMWFWSRSGAHSIPGWKRLRSVRINQRK